MSIADAAMIFLFLLVTMLLFVIAYSCDRMTRKLGSSDSAQPLQGKGHEQQANIATILYGLAIASATVTIAMIVAAIVLY